MCRMRFPVASASKVVVKPKAILLDRLLHSHLEPGTWNVEPQTAKLTCIGLTSSMGTWMVGMFGRNGLTISAS